MRTTDRIRRVAKPMLPRLAWLTSSMRRLVVKTLHAAGSSYCPVCECSVRRFSSHGDPPRANARCPVCSSLERHRLDWVFLAKETDLFAGKQQKMLHVAPEEFLSTRFRAIAGLDYLSADLHNPKAMVRMDITDIDIPNDTFDVIYCSHVLEHILDDRKAIAELHRVLRPGGWAMIQVPIKAERTIEDPAITDPAERRRHFGQWDHVRRCGPDYAERIGEAGFEVRVFRAIDVVGEADCGRMGVQPSRFVFHCRKSAGPAPGAATAHAAAASTARSSHRPDTISPAGPGTATS